MPSAGVEHTSMDYDAAIAICGEAGQPEKAFELFREMQQADNGTRYVLLCGIYRRCVPRCSSLGEIRFSVFENENVCLLKI